MSQLVVTPNLAQSPADAPPSQDDENKSRLSKGAIVGITVGGVVLLIIIGWIIWKRYGAKTQTERLLEQIQNSNSRMLKESGEL